MKSTLKVKRCICSIQLHFFERVLYIFHSIANGEPYVRKGDQSVSLPNQMDGILFERVANFVIVQAEGLGFTVKWDTKV